MSAVYNLQHYEKIINGDVVTGKIMKQVSELAKDTEYSRLMEQRYSCHHRALTWLEKSKQFSRESSDYDACICKAVHLLFYAKHVTEEAGKLMVGGMM